MALQLTGWQVVEQEAGITVTRLSSSAAEVLERCCVRVCVWHNVSACHGGKWWQTMANWSEGFPLLTHHANNRESEAWSGWENGCHKHIHGHTKVADTQSKIAQRRVNPTHTQRWGITAERFKGDSFVLIGRHFPNFFTHCALHLKQIQLKCSVFYVVDMLKFPEEEYRSGIFLLQARPIYAFLFAF